jgi:ATP phosphoribosyltransferase
VIVDIVQTGSTLKENGLVVLEKILRYFVGVYRKQSGA